MVLLKAWPGYPPLRVLLAIGPVTGERIRAFLHQRKCSLSCTGQIGNGADYFNDCAVILPCHTIVLRFVYFPELGAVVHECFHAVHDALPMIGVRFGEATNEAYAYAAESLVLAVLAIIGASYASGQHAKAADYNERHRGFWEWRTSR